MYFMVYMIWCLGVLGLRCYRPGPLQKITIKQEIIGYGIVYMQYIPKICTPWWRHQKETFSALLALCVGNSPVSGEFPSQRPVTRSFDVFFDLRLNKQLSKQSWGWWFERPSIPLWRHCNEFTICCVLLWFCGQQILHQYYSGFCPRCWLYHTKKFVWTSDTWG